MANIKIKLNRGVVVRGATEPRGEPTYGKAGEIHEFDEWTGRHLAAGDYPVGEIVSGKPK
jgi:hypothetical protein